MSYLACPAVGWRCAPERNKCKHKLVPPCHNLFGTLACQSLEFVHVGRIQKRLGREPRQAPRGHIIHQGATIKQNISKRHA